MLNLVKPQVEEIPTPAQEIIPAQMLCLVKHRHHNERMKIDPFTEHPEIIAGHHVLVKEVQNLAAHLSEKNKDT